MTDLLRALQTPSARQLRRDVRKMLGELVDFSQLRACLSDSRSHAAEARIRVRNDAESRRVLTRWLLTDALTPFEARAVTWALVVTAPSTIDWRST